MKNSSFQDFSLFFNTVSQLSKKHAFALSFSALIFSLSAFLFAKLNDSKYKAEIKFVLKNDTPSFGGMNGGLSTILGANAIGSPLERTVEIASSEKIIAAALLSEVDFNSRKIIIANSILGLYPRLMHKYSDSDNYFSKNDTSAFLMTYSKRKCFKELKEIVFPMKGQGVMSKTYDKKSGVVTISVTLPNEDIAILFVSQIFNKLRDFYVEQTTTSAVTNVLILTKKVDSIRAELSKVQSSYARTSDMSYGLLFQEDKVQLKKLAVKEQLLLAMYAEAQKNLETFKFMNDSAIPSLTIIDMPYSPLQVIKRSVLLYTLIGALVGFLIPFGLLLIIYHLRN